MLSNNVVLVLKDMDSQRDAVVRACCELYLRNTTARPVFLKVALAVSKSTASSSIRTRAAPLRNTKPADPIKWVNYHSQTPPRPLRMQHMLQRFLTSVRLSTC